MIDKKTVYDIVNIIIFVVCVMQLRALTVIYTHGSVTIIEPNLTILTLEIFMVGFVIVVFIYRCLKGGKND